MEYHYENLYFRFILYQKQICFICSFVVNIIRKFFSAHKHHPLTHGTWNIILYILLENEFINNYYYLKRSWKNFSKENVYGIFILGWHLILMFHTFAKPRNIIHKEEICRGTSLFSKYINSWSFSHVWEGERFHERNFYSTQFNFVTSI